MGHIRRNMAAAKVKVDEDASAKEEVALTLYDATPEPEAAASVTPPSFEGRLNLHEFAFQQPTNPFRRHRPTPKVEVSNSDLVKGQKTSPRKRKGKGGSRARPLIFTPTPEPDDARVTVKKEIKVERDVQIVTATASDSDQVATSTKAEKVEPNSPLIAPIQSTEWDLPIIKVLKPEPGEEGERVLEEVSRKKVCYRERVVPARPGPSVVPVASPSKRRSDSSSNSPAKKPRSSSSFVPPETYAHLKGLTDMMAHDLIGIFVGTNPGLKSARDQHTYAHPSNLFWKLLHTSGITERRVPPVEDATLPTKYQFGNTNIVDRPTRNQEELSKAEFLASVQALQDKVRKWKPEAVVIVGKKIWEVIWIARHGRGIKKHEFRYGWQDDSERMGAPKLWEPKETTVDGKPWVGARVFVATSTSGSAGFPKLPEKERIWRELGVWVNRRREERGLPHYPPGPTYQKPGAARQADEVEEDYEEDDHPPH